jgi:DNA-binding NarL/FixJ family response regulator
VSLLFQAISEAIGEEAAVLLSEQFGGQRLYIPHRFTGFDDVPNAIGRKAANALSGKCAPATIRVPLAREERAKHYLAQGMERAAIASRLGITERSTERLLDRLRKHRELVPESPLSGR